MQKANLFRIIRLVIGFGLFAVVVFYVAVCIVIFTDVKKITKFAQQKYSGSPVEALYITLADSTISFEEKNDAVYALGQIGDKTSLPILQSLRSGQACEKPCRKDIYICQYELDKAIRGCSSEFSATRWMYTFLD